MKKTYLLLAVLFAACSNNEDMQQITPSDEGGRITFSLESESVIEMTTTTRADSGYTIDASLLPTDEDFAATIYQRSYDDDGAEVYTKYSEYSSLKNYNEAEADASDATNRVPPYMPAGDYTLSITDNNSTTEESSTNACFAGGCDFTIVARKTDSEATVTATLQNSIIRLQTTDQFDQYFEGGSTLTLSTSQGTELTIDFPLSSSTKETILFVTPGTTLYLSGSAIKQDPGDGSAPEVTFTKASVGEAIASKMNTVVVDAPNVGQGYITITLDSQITNVNIIDINL